LLASLLLLPCSAIDASVFGISPGINAGSLAPLLLMVSCCLLASLLLLALLSHFCCSEVPVDGVPAIAGVLLLLAFLMFFHGVPPVLDSFL
jgi:hypothetical protein